MSKYLHLLSFNYLQNIVKNSKFQNKNVKKYFDEKKTIFQTQMKNTET